MKKGMNIVAIALMMVGLTACHCTPKSKCCGGDGEACCAKKECPEGCTKPCCAKPEAAPEAAE